MRPMRMEKAIIIDDDLIQSAGTFRSPHVDRSPSQGTNFLPINEMGLITIRIAVKARICIYCFHLSNSPEIE